MDAQQSLLEAATYWQNLMNQDLEEGSDFGLTFWGPAASKAFKWLKLLEEGEGYQLEVLQEKEMYRLYKDGREVDFLSS